jgi:ABC-type uncharacterized transport system auxiliary subunit
METRRAVAIVLSSALSLAGCAHVRSPKYYMLDLPAPPSPAAHPTLGAIAVREFDAASFLRGGAIAYRESPTELEFYQYHRWAVDPRRSVTDAVVREFQSLGNFRSAAIYDGQEKPDFLLTGAINHLEEVDSGTAVSVTVALSAQITDVKTGEVLWHGDSERSAQLDRHSLAGVVERLSLETNLAVKHLAVSIRDRLVAATAAAGGSR